MNQIPNIEETVNEIAKTVYVSFDTTMPGAIHTYGQIPGLNATIAKVFHHQLQKAREEERERINQFFAVKADYDTESDCVIFTDKVYHQAFFPDGCGSDGQNGRNRCEICYKYRTKFGQNILAKLEPNHSELDQDITKDNS